MNKNKYLIGRGCSLSVYVHGYTDMRTSSSFELNLVALKVSLVLDHFDKWLGSTDDCETSKCWI